MYLSFMFIFLFFVTWWSDSLQCLRGPGFSLRNRVLFNPVGGWISAQIQLGENSNKTKWSNYYVLIHSISMLPSTQLGVVMRKPYVRHLARTNKPTGKWSYDEIIVFFVCLFDFIDHQREPAATYRLPHKTSWANICSPFWFLRVLCSESNMN